MSCPRAALRCRRRRRRGCPSTVNGVSPQLPPSGTAADERRRLDAGHARARCSIARLEEARDLVRRRAFRSAGSRNCSVNTFGVESERHAAAPRAGSATSSADTATSATDSAISTTTRRVARAAAAARRALEAGLQRAAGDRAARRAAPAPGRRARIATARRPCVNRRTVAVERQMRSESARDRRAQPRERLAAPSGPITRPSRGGDGREQRRLDGSCRVTARAARAERGAQRDLLLAIDGAREQQLADVDARDEQHRADRREQQQERRPRRRRRRCPAPTRAQLVRPCLRDGIAAARGAARRRRDPPVRRRDRRRPASSRPTLSIDARATRPARGRRGTGK